MMQSFAHPEILWLLPLAGLPALSGVLRRRAFPCLTEAPQDILSRCVGVFLTFAGVAATACIALALAGPRIGGGAIERIGVGAETALLVDRSGSMNDTFAGRQPQGGEESKASASRRVLQDYVRRRRHDRFGVIGFSTLPMPMLPLTEHLDAVLAAVASIDRPGLAYTDIGRGLAAAFDMIEDASSQSSRVILVVSDGAAVIDTKVQDRLRAAFARIHVNLYWLFLRTANSTGISDAPKPGEDTPQAMPERHLDLFFKSLKIPYKAFEVEDPAAVEAAVAEIGRLETRPIAYRERLPLRDLSGLFSALALAFVFALFLAKMFETSLASPRPAVEPAEPRQRPAARRAARKAA